MIYTRRTVNNCKQLFFWTERRSALWKIVYFINTIWMFLACICFLDACWKSKNSSNALNLFTRLWNTTFKTVQQSNQKQEHESCQSTASRVPTHPVQKVVIPEGSIQHSHDHITPTTLHLMRTAGFTSLSSTLTLICNCASAGSTIKCFFTGSITINQSVDRLYVLLL